MRAYKPFGARYRRNGSIMRIHRMRFKWLSIAAACIVAFVATLAFVFPAVAAATCPQCYGFERIDDGLFVERSMTPDERAKTSDIIHRARERIRGFYGEQLGTASILICATNECYRNMRGGGSRGTAYYDTAILLAPNGANEVIATHELSHIEFHKRIGALRAFMGTAPAWFDEGLAVIVSDDRRYIEAEDHTDRCRMRSDEALPLTSREWRRTAEASNGYALAACRVSEWMKTRGGSTAVLALARRIANGETFDAAYR